MKQTVLITPLNFGNPSVLPEVANAVQTQLDVEIRIVQHEIDVSFAYDNSRAQYNSTKILKALLHFVEQPTHKILGVTDVDLFIPILTYVFGEAQVKGPAAVVSSFRLRPDFYGLGQNDELTLARLKKEAVHELGHAYGLRHCDYYECVMSSNTYADEIDIKSEVFCEFCQEDLNILRQQDKGPAA